MEENYTFTFVWQFPILLWIVTSTDTLSLNPPRDFPTVLVPIKVWKVFGSSFCWPVMNINGQKTSSVINYQSKLRGQGSGGGRCSSQLGHWPLAEPLLGTVALGKVQLGWFSVRGIKAHWVHQRIKRSGNECCLMETWHSLLIHLKMTLDFPSA